MSSDKSNKPFVHEESPPPAYVAPDTLQKPRLTSHNDNFIPRVLSPQAFKAEHFKDGVKITTADRIHDPAQEPLPGHPYFQLDVSQLHLDIETALRDLWIALQGFEDDDMEMANQREAIQQGRDIRAPRPLVVTTVGPAGVGKSYLYKALFSRPNIAKSSAEGRSCTLYPTKIELQHDMPDTTKNSNIDIDLFQAVTIANMADSHIRSYYDYHFGPENDPDDDDSRRHATTAIDFFKVAFSKDGNPLSDNYLQPLLTAEMISSGNLLSTCVDTIEKWILSLGASESRKLSYLHVDDDEIDQIRSIADSLAPFVDFFVIKTGAPLLRAGLTFIDLPGLRDINQGRVARANAVRRKVDVELVVCDRPERGLEDADLDALIRQSIRAHGFENTILVYNKVDTMFMSGVQDANDRVRNSSQEPYTTIKACLIQARGIEDATVKRSYLTYLQEVTLNYMIRERAHTLQRNIVEKYAALDPDAPDNLTVFAISAAQYLEWQDPSRLRAPVMGVTDTQVPDLKQYLLSLTGKRNYEHLWNHIHLVMAEIADGCTRVLEKVGDEVGYSAFCEQLAQEQIPTLHTDLSKLANTQLIRSQLIRSQQIWSSQPEAEQQLDSIKDVIAGWQQTANGPLLVASFNKALRENGFIANSRARALQGLRINWNQTLQECMEPALEKFIQKMSAQLSSRWDQMSSRIDDCMNDVFSALEDSSDHTPFITSFHREWRKLEHAVFTKKGSFEFQLHRVVRATQRFATTEEDVGCLVASLMAPIYLKVSQKTGAGKYSRQVAAMKRYLVTKGWNGGTIIDRYENAVVADLEGRLRPVVHWFLNEIKADMLNFVRVMEELLASDQKLTVGQRRARKKLRAALPVYEEILRRVQGTVPALED